MTSTNVPQAVGARPDIHHTSLIDEEQKTGDPKKRVALLHQAGRILMEDVPFVPLYTLAEIYGVVRNVIWKARPDEKIIAAEMKIR